MARKKKKKKEKMVRNMVRNQFEWRWKRQIWVRNMIKLQTKSTKFRQISKKQQITAFIQKNHSKNLLKKIFSTQKMIDRNIKYTQLKVVVVKDFLKKFTKFLE